MTIVLKWPLEEVLEHCGLASFPPVPQHRRHVDRYGGMIRVLRIRRRLLPHNGEWDVLEAWLYAEDRRHLGWELASHWTPRSSAGKSKAPAPWVIAPADPPRDDEHWSELLEMSA